MAKFRAHRFGQALPYSNYENDGDEEPELSPEDVQKVLDRFDKRFHGEKSGPKLKDIPGLDLDEHLRKMYRRYFTG